MTSTWCWDMPNLRKQTARRCKCVIWNSVWQKLVYSHGVLRSVILSSIFVRHCDRGGTTQLLMFGSLSSNTGWLYGFPLVAEAALRPRLKASHCKPLKATAEKVEQIKTVGGSLVNHCSRGLAVGNDKKKHASCFPFCDRSLHGHLYCIFFSIFTSTLSAAHKADISNLAGSGRSWFPI